MYRFKVIFFLKKTNTFLEKMLLFKLLPNKIV